MKSRYLTTLAVVIAVTIGIGLCGCKKEEPEKEDNSPKQSIEQKRLINYPADDWYSPWPPLLDSDEEIKTEPGYFFPIPPPIFDPIKNQKQITTYPPHAVSSQ